MRIWVAAMVALLGIAAVATAVIDSPAGPPAPAGRLAAAPPQASAPPAPRTIDCAKARCVALTFDDGPDKHTAALLDILAEHRARATFFVIGEKVADHGAGELKRMIAEGHELGNHSWSHAQLTALSPAALASQLRRTQEIVQQATGVRMVLLRPPYGATDRQVAAESRRQGLAQILWDIDTRDWLDLDSALVLRRAGKAAPGSIVLLHDIHRTTIMAVPELLKDLAAKKYTFVTVSELYGTALTPGRRYTRR